MTSRRAAVLVLLLIAAAVYLLLDLGDWLRLQTLIEGRQRLLGAVAAQPGLAALLYFLAYVAVAGLSLPGALVMTLAGGMMFGLLWGVVLISFASTIGASLAFLLARFLLRDWVQNRYAAKLETVNSEVRRQGGFYLFSLRMIPLFPFFLVNLLMALTPISLPRFYLVSQLGMLPATLVYVNAGAQLTSIDGPGDLVSPVVLTAIALVGLSPWLARALLRWLRRWRLYRDYPRPRRFERNLVVIGAGAAGLVSSAIAAGAGAKVTLIERERMGGDCLNTGCVPSKTLLRSARLVAQLRRAADFGLRTPPAEVDFSAVMARVDDSIAQIAPHDSVERFSAMGVECLQGKARLLSPWEVQVGERRITAPNIILATGARPIVPAVEGLLPEESLTSETVWGLHGCPERLLVLGAGPIGCELAQAFARLGSRVTLIDQESRVLPREDPEVGELLAKRLRAEGVEIHTGCRALRAGGDDGARHLVVDAGEERRLPFDRVLIAIGRRADTQGMGLTELGIGTADDGGIEVDRYLRTALPNVYACGDAVGPWQFTHMASHQAWYASMNALLGGWKKFAVDYRTVPWTIFTDPQIARVGLSQTEAERGGTPFEVTRYELDGLDRAVCDAATTGFVKVLTVPGRDRILGATIVADSAGEMLPEFVLAMRNGLGLGKILASIHVYPTWNEANRQVAGAWRRARVPDWALRLATAWNRRRLG